MKNYIVGFVAVAALIVGVLGFSKTPNVVVGPQGEQGIQGVKGDKGDRGLQGIQGERGQKGESGAIGMPGKLGAITGGDVYTRMFLNSGFTAGGRLATTTTAATYTTSAKDFNGLPTYWDFTPNVNTTITFNATSTHGYVPNIGDVATIYLRNASSTATATITLAAQNGSVDLQTSEATGGDLILNGLDWAKLTFIREAAQTTTIIFDEFTEAD